MKSNYDRIAIAALAFATFYVCTPVRAAFTNVSANSGINHIHSLRSDEVNNHAGLAAVDVDGDGLTDLLFAKFASPPLLYINKGNGIFEEEAAAHGLSAAIDAAAFGAGDFDNDGDPDLMIVPHEGSRFFLYINDGTGHFTEDAVARGADVPVSLQDHNGYSVGLVDYDLDGYLDVYVSEWGITKDAEASSHSVLLRNVGASSPGHFTNVTAAAGLTQPAGSNIQHGYSSGWGDFDDDGWPDLVLVVDYGKSRIYWNDGDGTFTPSSGGSGIGHDENGMGIAVADYDGDGLLDFYVTSIFDGYSFEKDGSHTGNKLYRNTGDRHFQEMSFEAGVGRAGWGWGAAFFEYDNDGDFDIIATNGMNIAEGADINNVPYVAAASDQTQLFVNDGSGVFARGQNSGVTDAKYGKGVSVLDFDNDGDQDVVIANSFSRPIVYRSDASANGNDWIRFTFEGTISNRDGIGAKVRVTEGGKTQYLTYNPSNSYIGQHEAALHFGLGSSDGTVDSVSVTWPTGLTQELTNLAVNEVHDILEPDDAPTPPIFSTQPTVSGNFEFGDSLDLNVGAIGNPAPTFVWEKDGEVIEGVSGSRLHIKRLAPYDAGSYRARAINSAGDVLSNAAVVEVFVDLEGHSVARWWNEFMMEAIRRDFPDPTKHSRNLYHVSAGMWDAFWAYEVEGWLKAKPAFHQEDVHPFHWNGDREASQLEAISHAAFTVLKRRYMDSPGSERSEFGFRWLMEQYGFDPDFTSQEGDSPAAVGNRIGHAILSIGYEDGSNELDGYVDTSGYEAVNEPLIVHLKGTSAEDVNRWQPLAFDFAISQNGIPLGALVQTFLGVNWREVDTFALKKTSQNTIAFDPGPPPQFSGDTKEAFRDSVVEVIRYSSYLDPADETMINISPGRRLNNAIGTNDGTGRPLNPITQQPYADNFVKRADYGRILAEFWADGPASETPPGHWNSLHNEITSEEGFERRYMGVGPELSALEWDVRAYLALNGGMHDAAMAAWTLKRQYDYSRPITMIRYLGGKGQSSDPDLPSYSEDGLPLVPGLIELITEESAAVGERHENFVFNIGEIAIYAWAGEPDDAESGVGGVEWILAEDWVPYQRSTFVTPAFGAYVSGHSTFSRAGAEVMTLLTGSPYFPGGMGEFEFPEGEFLEFENGPSADVELQWATYYDAADQAGISRLYGGIHVRADDFVGRILGARLGVEAFVKAHTMRNFADAPGLFDEIVGSQSLEAGSGATMALFEVVGGYLPARFVSSVEQADAGDAASIYFVIPDGAGQGDESEYSVQSKSGLVQGIEIRGTVSETKTLAIEFVLGADEPMIVFATGQGSSLAGGAADTKLILENWTNGAWVEIDENTDWRDHETASLSEALLLRRDSSARLQEKESALPLALVSGRYRVSLQSIGAGGIARLHLGGQNWRE